jgi:hypothetical protein
MQPQTNNLRELKAQALKAGAKGVMIVRGVENAELEYEFEDSMPLSLELDGRMVMLAVFEETDGEPNGIES